MKSGIYMIINLSNRKVYVGSSKDISVRLSQHKRRLKNNNHENVYLQNAYNKYGDNMFKFISIEYCELDLLIERELFWIDIKKSNERQYGYNLSLPLNQGGCIFSEKTLDKIRRNAYERHHGKLTEEEYQQKLKKKEEYNNRERLITKIKVFGFDKITGELIKTFNSISEISNSYSITKKIDSLKYSYKGLVLVRESNYNPDIKYIQIIKEKKLYLPKGPFKGKPVQTYNLETKEVIENYNNKYHIAEVFTTSVNYINKVFSGEKKSFRGMGIRYST